MDIEKAAAKVFILPHQNIAGDEMAERFIFHRHKIARRAVKNGPMIYRLYPKHLDKVL